MDYWVQLSRAKLVLCAFACIFYAGGADAKSKKIEALTEGNVTAFIEETSHMTTSGKKRSSLSKIKKYLDKHIEDDARFKSVMTYNIPGMPPQEQKVSIGKDEFIESVEKGGEEVDEYNHLIEIEEIKIASDKEKAFVKTKSSEIVNMPVPTNEGGTEYVPVEGESACTQILSLNKGVIQMYAANCKTTINIMEY